MKELNDQSQCLMRDRFFVRQGERMERCFYSEILYVEASGCYCYIYRKGKASLLVSCPLADVEKLLQGSMCRRVHRSYMVNLREVEGFVGKAICIGDRLIPVSLSYREEVFGCFVFWDLRREKKGTGDNESGK